MKIDARKQSRTDLLERRRQVIERYLAGMPVMQIVETSGLSWSAVNTAIKRYLEGSELKPSARGRKPGNGRLLSQAQEANVFRWLCNRRPWQTGTNPSRFLWSREAVRHLIKVKYGIELSPRGLDKYLQRWGLISTRTRKQPLEHCSRPIQKWLKENYSLIEQRAKTEGAAIFWASRIKASPSDIETTLSAGYDASVREPKKRWVITATNNQGKIHWMTVRGAFNRKRQIQFLRTLTQDNRKKVFLIRDDMKTYNEYEVLQWLSEHRDTIEIFPPIDSPTSK